MGKIKEQLLEDFLKSDIQVGEHVSFKTEMEKKSVFRKGKNSVETIKTEVVTFGFMHTTVTAVDKDKQTVTVHVHNRDYNFDKELPMSDVERDTRGIGTIPSPMREDTWSKRCRNTGLSLSFLISLLRGDRQEIICSKNENYPQELNFNPYIVDESGKKVYYQRDYCWDVEDEQLFIESIYNDLDCGKIVLRKNDINRVFDERDKGDDEICFYDIVDGKQRLNTLRRFMNDEFCDLHGNYYSDFSDYAKRFFENKNCITILEMESGSTDKDVIKVFLNVNFCGKPMSKEHIEFVRSLYNNIK